MPTATRKQRKQRKQSMPTATHKRRRHETGGGESIKDKYCKSMLAWRNDPMTNLAMPNAVRIQEMVHNQPVQAGSSQFKSLLQRAVQGSYKDEDQLSYLAFIKLMTNGLNVFIKNKLPDTHNVTTTKYIFKQDWFKENVVLSRQHHTDALQIYQLSTFLPPPPDSVAIDSEWHKNRLNAEKSGLDANTYTLELNDSCSKFVCKTKNRIFNTFNTEQTTDTKTCNLYVKQINNKWYLVLLSSNFVTSSTRFDNHFAKGFVQEHENENEAIKAMFKLVVLFQYDAFLKYVQDVVLSKALSIYNHKRVAELQSDWTTSLSLPTTVSLQPAPRNTPVTVVKPSAMRLSPRGPSAASSV